MREVDERRKERREGQERGGEGKERRREEERERGRERERGGEGERSEKREKKHSEGSRGSNRGRKMVERKRAREEEGGTVQPGCVRCAIHLREHTLCIYLQHESVFNVEHYLLLLSVVSYEGVDSITVGYPADETRVGGEGDDRVALNAASSKNQGEGGEGR